MHMNNIRLQQGIGMPLVIAIVAFALVIAGIAYYASQQQGNEAEKTQEPFDATQGKEKEEETMMPAMTNYSGKVLAGKSSPLLDFAKIDYDMAKNSDKLVVLYFYANWCPICKEEVANALYPAFNELTGDRVIGFRVNYNDNETDGDERNLAREFGIAYQHTKVFLKNAQRILKSPESWNKDRYINEIMKALLTI